MAEGNVEMIPGARRLIRSLRDMGYEFAPAVADLIDNCIEARANSVRVEVVWEGEDSYVLIADNGAGMSPASLREAMRYGAERDYDDGDLGKFGLGLKTASMSQCTRLTVVSRQNVSRADIAAYCWDLGHIEATNRWEILPVRTSDLPAAVRQHLKETTGTVVVWEKLDRILGYKYAAGEFARKQLLMMCRDLEEHLAMVFHRFLSGEVRGRKLSIYINGNKVQPWDPFARAEEHTKLLEPVTLRLDTGAVRSDVVVEPFVLPPQKKFSTPEAHTRAGGPNKWNRQQGFYIYRADRMIQSGGWSNLRTLDEHMKLARVALYFLPKLDEEFKINVPKMRVQLPSTIRDEIASAIAPALQIANATYRKHGKGSDLPIPPSGVRPPPDVFVDEQPKWPGKGKAPSTLEGISSTSHSDKSFDTAAFRQLTKLMEEVSTADELPVVRSVAQRVKDKIGGGLRG